MTHCWREQSESDVAGLVEGSLGWVHDGRHGQTLTVTAHATDNVKASPKIGNYAGDWYYHYTSPEGVNCSLVVPPARPMRA